MCAPTILLAGIDSWAKQGLWNDQVLGKLCRKNGRPVKMFHYLSGKTRQPVKKLC